MSEQIPPRLRELELYGWIGEDEFGSGEIGIKQGLVPAGFIPLVAIDFLKMSRREIFEALEGQAQMYGKKIYLCRFSLVEVMDSTLNGAAA